MSEAIKPTPGSCPFCGHVGLDFAEGSTFRWIVASCGGCGASLAETRIQTLGEGTKDEWMAEAKADAIAAWNRRSDPLVERVKELEEALRDMHAGWRYIRRNHGDLYGVGWDRCEEKASAALSKALPSTVAEVK
jgi:hypothetical protein